MKHSWANVKLGLEGQLGGPFFIMALKRTEGFLSQTLKGVDHFNGTN